MSNRWKDGDYHGAGAQVEVPSVVHVPFEMSCGHVHRGNVECDQDFQGLQLG